ncbi:MAG: glycosyltransferase family 4 protein [Candidatus Pacebacteria bacterium]|nr:glycosyltransferase family 4 protein [Candidatus Paceibacterota bacterium]
MRIAQLVSLQESVPPNGKNGLESMVYYLTEELVRRGHEVTLFATSDSKTSARLIEILPYPMSRGVLFGMSPTHYTLTVMAKAAEMSEEFDIIHSHLGAPSYYFSNLIKTPIVETIHSEMKKTLSDPNKQRYEKYREDRDRRFYKVHHVYVSGKQKENSKLTKNASVVHNGISLSEFEFNSKGGDYFAYLGYINENKGAHLAVEAAVKSGMKLKLAGGCYGCEKFFDEKIKPHLKSGQIEYVGVVNPEERSRFLGGAKGLLFPINWEEPFGLVMIEAMACGTPVIGLDRASVPEVVVEGKTGFVAEDVSGMLQAMERIDSISRDECRRYVENNFSVEKMAENYEKVYAKVINDSDEKKA